jgi:hypothetical protein
VLIDWTRKQKRRSPWFRSSGFACHTTITRPATLHTPKTSLGSRTSITYPLIHTPERWYSKRKSPTSECTLLAFIPEPQEERPSRGRKAAGTGRKAAGICWTGILGSRHQRRIACGGCEPQGWKGASWKTLWEAPLDHRSDYTAWVNQEDGTSGSEERLAVGAPTLPWLTARDHPLPASMVDTSISGGLWYPIGYIPASNVLLNLCP